jgi:hypothetical protein
MVVRVHMVRITWMAHGPGLGQGWWRSTVGARPGRPPPGRPWVTGNCLVALDSLCDGDQDGEAVLAETSNEDEE